MSAQAMGSHGGGAQQSQFQNLPRQGSMYNLTLNEVQSQLGEPLHSMNLDELLRNVLPAEIDQPLCLDLKNTSAQLASGSSIQRQGSVTLTREMSKKTVDEVWKDIQEGQSNSSNGRAQRHERQSTLGEMTLEDFLVRAGVVTDGLDKARADNIANVGSSGRSDPVVGAQGYAQGVHWLQQFHQMPTLQRQQQQVPQSIAGAYLQGHPVQQQSSSMLDPGYHDNQLIISSPMMGTLSDTQTPGKRIAPGDLVEKTVERRQKRMIKNRESAARSRARKQAYTNELENKVSRLEEENEKLKKQKELDKILYSAPPPEPKFRLRRTSSAPI